MVGRSRLSPPRHLQDASKTVQHAPRALQDASKTLQDASKTLQYGSETLQGAPRCSQDAPRHLQDAPTHLQDASKMRFWWILGATTRAEQEIWTLPYKVLRRPQTQYFPPCLFGLIFKRFTPSSTSYQVLNVCESVFLVFDHDRSAATSRKASSIKDYLDTEVLPHEPDFVLIVESRLHGTASRQARRWWRRRGYLFKPSPAQLGAGKGRKGGVFIA